ncbi:MAG: hypothetical protein U0703_04415 [Anaerolineae bacterium]
MSVAAARHGVERAVDVVRVALLAQAERARQESIQRVTDFLRRAAARKGEAPATTTGSAATGTAIAAALLGRFNPGEALASGDAAEQPGCDGNVIGQPLRQRVMPALAAACRC